MKGRRHLGFIGVAVVGVVACSETGSEAPRVLTWDSADVTFVETERGSHWSESPRVVEELRIGVLDGPPEYEFARVTSLDVDAEERIYVLDRSAQHVRVFDRSGRFLIRIGRPGEGPSELSAQANPVMLIGTSVFVPDFAARSVRRFNVNGEEEGTSRFSHDLLPDAGWGVSWDASDDGHILKVVREGMEPARYVLERWSPEGEFVSRVLVLGSDDAVRVENGRLVTVVHGSRPVWALTADGRVLVARTSEPRVEVWDLEGELLRIIVLDRDEIPITDEMAADLVPSGASAIGRVMFQVPPVLPVLTEVMGGPYGTIWVKLVDGLDGREPVGPWHVFDREGRLLGPIELPDRFTPLKVKDDRVFGVGLDEFDVQYIARLRVEGLR